MSAPQFHCVVTNPYLTLRKLTSNFSLTASTSLPDVVKQVGVSRLRARSQF